MENPIRIRLSESDFKTLVSGGIVKQDGVEIILQDIGFDQMRKSVLLAEIEQKAK